MSIDPKKHLLPCDVMLPPATKINRGATLATLLVAMKQRESFSSAELVFTEDWQAGAIEAGAADADAGNLTPLEDVKAKWSTPPSAQVQGEREVFKAWCARIGYALASYEGGNGYRPGYGSELWSAWQARAALSAPPAAGVPEGWRRAVYQAEECLTGCLASLEIARSLDVEAVRKIIANLQATRFAMLAAPTPPASEQQQAVVASKYDEVLLPFLKMMEAELHANAGKGDRPGWLAMDRATALLEIYYHLAKLQKAAKDNNASGIREHAADVANMSMMLVDICDLLLENDGGES